MEQVIVTLQTNPECGGIHAEITNLHIGLDELPARGKSVQQLLNEMKEQGWKVVRSSAIPRAHSMELRYEFIRDNDTVAM